MVVGYHHLFLGNPPISPTLKTATDTVPEQRHFYDFVPLALTYHFQSLRHSSVRGWRWWCVTGILNKRKYIYTDITLQGRWWWVRPPWFCWKNLEKACGHLYNQNHIQSLQDILLYWFRKSWNTIQGLIKPNLDNLHHIWKMSIPNMLANIFCGCPKWPNCRLSEPDLIRKVSNDLVIWDREMI